MQNRWTNEQLRQTFYLYCTLPFGQLHSKTPAIVHLAARLGRTPSAVAMKLVNFASLDPVIAKSGRKGLSGASANDKKIWAQCHADWTGVAEQYEVTDDASTLETNLPFNAGADVMRTTKARIGQQFFRTSVLANCANRCCISGLNIPALLVASHISPWAVDSHNRLNPSNGLCLSSLHDAALTKGSSP
jgi:putative restriction endonuclease